MTSTEPLPSAEPKPPRKKVAAAWAVHAFTATGVVLGMLALIAMLRGDEIRAFFWLGMALFVDGIDGTLARRFKVVELTPNFDGAALDMVIDFVTYSFIPALMVYWFGLVPPMFGVAAACYIAATSLYCYANRGMKTDDYYFEGFPAVWNLVVLYFFILRTPSWLNLAVVVVLGILTFVPWKYVHPLRVVTLRPLTIIATVIWSAATVLLTIRADQVEHPAIGEPMVFWMWVATSVYFAGLCAWRTIEGGREEE